MAELSENSITITYKWFCLDIGRRLLLQYILLQKSIKEIILIQNI